MHDLLKPTKLLHQTRKRGKTINMIDKWNNSGFGNLLASEYDIIKGGYHKFITNLH